MLQIKLQSGLCRTHFPLLLLILFFLYHGLQTRNPDASYFSPAEGSDFLASCASCCVGGLKLPSGPVMWLGLSGLLWTSGHHFSLTHLLFQRKLGPSVSSNRTIQNCSLEPGIWCFFIYFILIFSFILSPLDRLTRQRCQKAIPSNSCLPDFALSFLLLIFWAAFPWKFEFRHMLLVNSAAKCILSLSGRPNPNLTAALPFLCRLPSFRRYARDVLLLHLEVHGDIVLVSSECHKSNTHASFPLFPF